MRSPPTLGLMLTAAIAIALSAEHDARAQSFPGEGGTAVWSAMLRGGNPVTDEPRAGAGSPTDLVGDATDAAAFVASDASYLFLRLRVNGDPADGALFVDDSAWGCLIDTDGKESGYEFFAGVDGAGPNTDRVRYRWNAVADASGTTNDAAELQIPSAIFPIATHARVSTAATSFSADPDYFVDFAIPWATLRAPGNGAPNVPAATPLRFMCGTRTGNTVADGINADVVDGSSPDAVLPVPLTGKWSDRYLCNVGGNAGCTTYVDTDGDTLSDATEAALGTSPTLADSDGDGIPDAVEVTPIGGGAPAKVDTDGDGVIDALDLDSDGDGISDRDEGAATDGDGDGVPNFRDDDDDNDGIKTRDEISDTRGARVADDVDQDGKPNWLDNDADGDGIDDATEGRGDDNGNGVPNYLDAVKGGAPDAGPVPETPDAAPAPDAGPPPEGGVVEGAGLLCASSPAPPRPPSRVVWGVFVAAPIAVTWRRRRRRRGARRAD